MQKEEILKDFLNLSDSSLFQKKINQITNEKLAESLIKLRSEYSAEMLTPGCKPCKQAALKRKYSTALESTIEKYENNS